MSGMSDLTEECEQAIAREEIAREILVSKQKAHVEQLQALDVECSGIIDTAMHNLVTPKPVSKDVIAKANQDKKKGMMRAEARGEPYVMPERLRCNFEDISKYEKAVAENQRLSELNRAIWYANSQNQATRGIIEDKKKPLLKQLRKLKKYIAECDSTIRIYEKKLRYVVYAREHQLDVSLDDIIDVCNRHRNADICRQLCSQGYTGYSKCCKNYNECDEVMTMTSYHHAECECGYSCWDMSENPSADFDITSNSAEGEDDNLSYFGNPSLPRT